MRRFQRFILALTCLLALAACGGDAAQDPTPQDGGAEDAGDVTVYDCGGYQAALPNEYLDLLYVDTDFSGAEESWKPLISVYEKASYDAAVEDYGEGAGFLFGFLAMDQAAFEQQISAGIPGVEVFATDGERYYAYTFPTDVQFYRSGGEISTQSEDWGTWEELNGLGPLVREDFLTRNGLQTFSVQSFLDQRAGDDTCVRYYPYFLKDGDTRVYYQLLLRQPARQGEGGIWAVEQWLDESGSSYFYFPDTGKPAAEHYAELQEQCDAGQHPELLTPVGAAGAFAADYFGHETNENSFEEVRAIDRDYTERNRRLQQLVLDVTLGEAVDDLDLLSCAGEATADNWGVLGRYMYGSDWFQPLMDAVAKAATGENQQERDRAVMAFFLATRDARTDFSTPLGEILNIQGEADPAAFTAALAEFPEEDQTFIRLHTAVLK